MSAVTPVQTPPKSASGADVVDWRPEDPAFWETTGKRIAYRNLALSVPALLCGFAVWGMWGIITVQMLNLGFPFTQAELFTLTAIAGIAGATMRIPASFLIRLAGGRNTIFLTTAMLLAPAIGTGIVLQHKDWPLWSFQLMALWSGVGGGNFASSMSNISTFFPKRLQGTALGIFGTGMLLGAGLAFLLAPTTGQQLRRNLAEKLNEVGQKLDRSKEASTAAPADTSARAIPSPIPRPAPVIRATFPSTRNCTASIRGGYATRSTGGAEARHPPL